ncbi:MAG: TauD/TfdA dioxygenase family protein [Acidimicrobiia bacterium]
MTATMTYTYLKPDPRSMRRLAPGQDDRPYTMFDIRPLTPVIGAEIAGIDLRTPLTSELHAEIHRALLEWKVVFFRDQHLTSEGQSRFALNWGAVDVHPFYPPAGADHVVRFARGAELTSIGRENTWHTDVTFFERPSMAAILRAVEVPAFGGDTLFADMGVAYDLLADDVKERIDGLEAEHEWDHIFGARLDPQVRAKRLEEFPVVRHPVVRVHPETGRKMIYVNRPFTRRIVGLDQHESDQLLDILYRQADLPEVQCRFHWTNGALAFWDNRAVQHYAASDYFPAARVMDRVSIADPVRP